jgi:hypothetical protein
MSKHLKIATAFLMFGCAGCAHTGSVCIKAVDRSTRQPLSDLNVRWREDSPYNLLTGSQHESGPVMLVTDTGGMIKVIVHAKWESRFIFYREGRPAAYAIWSETPETFSVGTGLLASSASSEKFIIAEASDTEVRRTNGCFTVALPP